MRYKKILVAIDRSPQADAVFEQALELAKKEEASLMLLYCVPLKSERSNFYVDVHSVELVNYTQENQEQLNNEQEEARRWLANYGQIATAQGILTEWDVKVGDANKAIAELAEAWNADLVVVGRRGHRGLAEILLGSVSNYVVHHAPCSVLVVQGTHSPVDETPEAVAE